MAPYSLSLSPISLSHYLSPPPALLSFCNVNISVPSRKLSVAEAPLLLSEESEPPQEILAALPEKMNLKRTIPDDPLFIHIKTTM
jgi:hypothetical protein